MFKPENGNWIFYMRFIGIQVILNASLKSDKNGTKSIPLKQFTWTYMFLFYYMLYFSFMVRFFIARLTQWKWQSVASGFNTLDWISNCDILWNVRSSFMCQGLLGWGKSCLSTTSGLLLRYFKILTIPICPCLSTDSNKLADIGARYPLPLISLLLIWPVSVKFFVPFFFIICPRNLSSLFLIVSVCVSFFPSYLRFLRYFQVLSMVCLEFLGRITSLSLDISSILC